MFWGQYNNLLLRNRLSNLRSNVLYMIIYFGTQVDSETCSEIMCKFIEIYSVGDRVFSIENYFVISFMILEFIICGQAFRHYWELYVLERRYFLIQRLYIARFWSSIAWFMDNLVVFMNETLFISTVDRNTLSGHYMFVNFYFYFRFINYFLILVKWIQIHERRWFLKYKLLFEAVFFFQILLRDFRFSLSKSLWNG